MASRRRVLVVFPTAWDRRQLESCRDRWSRDYEVIFSQPTDEDCPSDLEILGFIDRIVESERGRIDGVFSSSDYPGATVAAAVATALGLPGSRPETVIRCSHKYASRLSQRQSVPEATPWFVAVDARKPRDLPADLRFPCFVKPVKGAFSVLARKVESAAELTGFLDRPVVREFTTSTLDMFNRLVRRFTELEIDGRYFIAEGLLRGSQATVEGAACDGSVEILGIVDSTTHPETGSFTRFDHPSSLPASVQWRMEDIARRAISGLGLERSLFNIEMIHDPDTDKVAILEINPRMCGQFADLYEKVDGTNGYEVALALATGGKPRIERAGGGYRAASSFPLRIFAPARVRRAPGEKELREAERTFPGMLAWSECSTGQALADFETIEDGRSCRYAIVNLGGNSREAVLGRFEEVKERLGYEFEAL